MKPNEYTIRILRKTQQAYYRQLANDLIYSI